MHPLKIQIPPVPPPLPFDNFLIETLALIANINSRFSGEVVELVVSASIFNPVLLPDVDTLLSAYGNSKLSTLDNFYGEKAEVMFEGVTYSSFAIINKEELLEEWHVFKRALFQDEIPAHHLCKT